MRYAFRTALQILKISFISISRCSGLVLPHAHLYEFEYLSKKLLAQICHTSVKLFHKIRNNQLYACKQHLTQITNLLASQTTFNICCDTNLLNYYNTLLLFSANARQLLTSWIAKHAQSYNVIFLPATARQLPVAGLCLTHIAKALHSFSDCMAIAPDMFIEVRFHHFRSLVRTFPLLTIALMLPEGQSNQSLSYGCRSHAPGTKGCLH